MRPARTSRRTRPRCRPHRLPRSEEHTSELQSRSDLVCRLLLEKKKHTNLQGRSDEAHRTEVQERESSATASPDILTQHSVQWHGIKEYQKSDLRKSQQHHPAI